MAPRNWPRGHGPGGDFETTRKDIQDLLSVKKVVPFWIGDLLNDGDGRWLDAPEMAKKKLGANYDPETLNRYKWVAAQVPVSRRRSQLSFEYHEEVAALSPGQQDDLLARAEREAWTLEDMCREVKRRSSS
jgi:hypothetical protein